jgi:hypothetical protein
MPSQTQLEILIKTVADSRGIALTEQEVKRLGDTLSHTQEQARKADTSADALARQFGEANRQAAEFGNSLRGLSNDQLLAVEEKLREQIKTTEGLGQSTDELKRKLEAAYNTRTNAQVDELGKRLRDASNQGTNFTRVGQQMTGQLNQTQRAMSGLSNVTAGLARGGFAGAVQAGRGFITILGGISRLAGPVGIALGAVGAALLVIRKNAAAAREEMEKLAKQGEANVGKYAAELEKLTAATEKQTEAQKTQLAELSAGYERLAADIANATTRADAQTNQRKELELAAARNPEDRAEVERKFANIEIDNKELRANQQRDVAERELTDLRGQRDSARNAARIIETSVAEKSALAAEATKEAEAAREAAIELRTKYDAFVQEQAGGFTIDTEEFKRVAAALPAAERRAKTSAQDAFDLVAEAEAAKTAAEDARAKLTELEQSLIAEMEEAQARIEAAAQALEEAATARKAQAIAAANDAIAATNADKAAIEDLIKQRGAAAASNAASAFRKAEQAIGEKQRAISGRQTTVATGDSIRAAEGLAPTTPTAPARSTSGGTITRNGETIDVAPSLAKAAQAQKDRDEVVIKFADEITRTSETTKRQISNSREKSQP